MSNEELCGLFEVIFNRDDSIKSFVVRDKLLAVKVNVVDSDGVPRNIWAPATAQEIADYEATNGNT